MFLKKIRVILIAAAPALLLLVLFMWVPVSRPDDAGESFDIQVVLGGNTRERSEVSFLLWQRHRTPILVTGDNFLIRNELLKLGVPESYILHEATARNTWENAEFSKPILLEHHVDNAVLVTSWFHTSRAHACFERVMPEIHFTTCSDPIPREIGWNMRKVAVIERTKKMYYWITRSVRPW